MARSTPVPTLGRHVFGLAAIAAGVVMFAWPEPRHYAQLSLLHNARAGTIVVAAAAAQVVGGAMMQLRATATWGAVALAAVYLLFSLLYVPAIITAPLVYDRWGNFFEQFSLASGATIASALGSPGFDRRVIRRWGAVALGMCAASFAIEQALHLSDTAGLVPRWLPPNQTTWAAATTAFFGLGAAALLTGLRTLLATRLLTAMLVVFGLLVWFPLVAANPHSFVNWSETTETFAIAGAVWILADALRE